MIITAAIVVGALAGHLAYRLLFYDRGDFLDGLVKFIAIFPRRRWLYRPKPPTPEDFEDEGWSSGLRFGLWLAVSVGVGVATYKGLCKWVG